MKKIFSRPSIMPDRTNHYDEHGHKIGYSRPSLLGTYTNHYDEHGHKVGRSREGLFGTVHYDENGHRVGRSHESILGYQNHYDNHGHKVGYTRDTLLGKQGDKKACAMDKIVGSGIVTAAKHNLVAFTIESFFCRDCKKMIFDTDVTK